MSSTWYTTIAWLPPPRLAETATCLPSGEMRGDVTWSVSAKASIGTGSAAWAQMQASQNAAATTAILPCFLLFPKPAPRKVDQAYGPRLSVGDAAARQRLWGAWRFDSSPSPPPSANCTTNP